MRPAWLVERHDIWVVPLAVVVHGATVTTSAPSPGQLVGAYDAAVVEGATEIVSIPLGSMYSATVAAATLAGSMADVPVRVLDAGASSFAARLCLLYTF